MDHQKIKICYVVAADITLKYLLLNNLKYLLDKGYEVSVVCSQGRWLDKIKKEGIKVKVIDIKRKIAPLSDMVSFVKLFSYFKKEQFNIVHTFTPKPGLLGQLAAKAARVPIIFNTIFGFYFHEGTLGLKRNFFILVEKVAASMSTEIFFRNQEDFTAAKALGIGNSRKNKYLGDGIDIDRFNSDRFSEEFIEEKKKKLGILKGVPLVGIVARLVKEKGYIELFLAFKKVLEKFPDAVLVSVGPEDSIKKDSFNKNIVTDFGIENNTLFLGERTDVDEIYAILDIFVLPSYREGFSHSIMEASAMALPIVASDIRGCRGAIEHGKTGILVTPKNVDMLSHAIIDLILHREKAQGMGYRAKAKARLEFDEKVIFEKTEAEYKKYIRPVNQVI